MTAPAGRSGAIALLLILAALAAAGIAYWQEAAPSAYAIIAGAAVAALVALRFGTRRPPPA